MNNLLVYMRPLKNGHTCYRLEAVFHNLLLLCASIPRCTCSQRLSQAKGELFSY